MRRSAAGFGALAAAALLVTIAHGAMAAGDGETPAGKGAPHVEKTFLIPSSDGYGVGECLTSPGSECGQVVANAWCEAQGYATANAYGIAAAEEYTGAVDLPVTKPADRPIRITCQD
ncbi:hypothetical protein MKK70_06790 [Methylobacterium sp. E-041]|jgi:hypothetical protein|uniref:hypothetical protein n=1 Tax=unclassified Methylobacterium TaxID=2615210 RepID=UPI0011CA4F99|nr:MULTISPECIES: hypothetical protein [unclassified Methylobacterium]MCJ2037445.1 hypothetical protein [Methylobacterium sp. J-059]MCJ2075676.1 hypothetical protein [Methylobacterium sp. E-016]MCJ2105097.1 hypothetical protein [Methylobacterium sp. E-041]MCJ2111537.1 hypothetical protein [Methylobacterium sp. E-025]TXM88431.1 hypothetical protein FV223_24590 [Methylobacterium sp. WL116]